MAAIPLKDLYRLYQKIGRKLTTGNCVTCGVRQIKDGGHFIPKTQHPSLAFLVMNIHGQCGHCNFHNFGEQWRMGCYIEERFGMAHQIEEWRSIKKVWSKKDREILLEWGEWALGLAEQEQGEDMRKFLHKCQINLEVYKFLR